MKERSGKVIYWKFAIKCALAPDMEKMAGAREVIKTTTTITMLKAIIRYLNFNISAPIMV